MMPLNRAVMPVRPMLSKPALVRPDPEKIVEVLASVEDMVPDRVPFLPLKSNLPR
jgi:hypothetical protein